MPYRNNYIKEMKKERETKRVQEFKKTFDFVNSHLLKGVATMAELTKSDNRQPMGKIKPTDKMVMMPSLFDGMKPAMSKQHYKRFNLYINFQTKSGHLADPVGEAIDLFKHMLDKTALVWFQTNRSKFKDLTMLKMMFLQRYNPWGKTKREQLQSWNILSFNPKTTDVDKHIDLINTLGDMVDQKEEAKKEKFIETMPTMIQTHLITCKDWATVKDTMKSLEHIIMKCDPPTPAMPMMATGAMVLGLYSHIAHSVDTEEGEIPQPFKGAKPKQTRAEVNLKENLKNKDKTHQKPKRWMKLILTKIITITTTMPQVRVEAAELIMVTAETNNFEGLHHEIEVKDLSIISISFKIITIREAHHNRIIHNTVAHVSPISDSQIKDDFQCDQDCYTQYSELTKDNHPNICTHDYQHITQNIQDLSDNTQQNNLYSREESVTSFTDDTDTHCNYSISNHTPDTENTNDTHMNFPPKHPAIHLQRKHAYRDTFGDAHIQ